MFSGPQASAYRALLRNRNYRLWFSSAFGSSLGDWVGLFALQTLIVSLTERGSSLALFALGGVMMARLLPSLLVGPVAGVLADRYDRKRLMVVTDVVRGALFVVIAFSQDLTTLFSLTFIVEVVSLVFIAAKDASLPVIVPKRQLTQANQLHVLVAYGTLPLGAFAATLMTAVAALLRPVLGDVSPPVLALLLNAATFFVAALLLARVDLPHHGRSEREGEPQGVLDELREGMRFISGFPLIRSLIIGVVGVFFGAGVVVTLGPEFVRTSLGRPDSDWPLLMTAVGAGLTAGIIPVGWLTQRLRPERLFPVALVATAAIAVVMATLPNFALTLVFGLGLGAGAGMSLVTGYTLLHANTRDEMRGKTFAAMYTVTRVSLFTALGLAPFVAGAIGRGTLIIGGSVVTMSGVRISILLGGLVGLFSAVTAARGMFRSLDAPLSGQVALPARDEDLAGVLIALEGVEGAGKSTQVRALATALEAEGREVVVTREPGGSAIAERIRALLLDPNAAGMHPRTEALLYAAARAEHVAQVIRPALDAGKVVITDRFVDSSLAYQGFARGLGVTDVLEINRWATGGLVPDVTVLLYLDPDEGLRRVAERERRRATSEQQDGPDVATLPIRGGDRLEQEDPEFHRRVAAGFLELAKREHERFVMVDASGEAGWIARQIRSGLHPWLPLIGGNGELESGEVAR